MCKDSKMLPTSYILQQESLRVSALCSYGGFADVGTGDYLGCCVAIKHLRFWAKDSSDKVFKVFGSSSTWYSTAIHFANSGFFGKS